MRRYRAKKYRYRNLGKLKKKKPAIFRNRFFWLGLLILTISTVLFYFAVFSSFFQIKEIRISKTMKAPAKNIEDIVFSQINKKIFFFNTKSIFLTDLQEINKEILEKFPQIARVDLKKHFPDTIIAKVEEREAIGVWSRDNNYFYIDKEGVIFNSVSNNIEKEKGDPVSSQILRIKDLSGLVENLQLGGKVIEKEQLNQILKIESKLKNDLKVPFREISIVSERRLNVKTIEGWEIYFNPKKDINWQLTELYFILKERISLDKRKNVEYVDLRFEKIYIFPETYNQ